MIDANEIVKRLFIWGVVAVAVVPRQHIDSTRCSIGGSLSHSFRKCLLGLGIVNFIRLLTKDNSIRGRTVILRDVLGVVQQLGHTFLCLLSPYLLQTWLEDYINLGGRPGSNLKPALVTTFGLSILASLLARNVNGRFWALRKFGNLLSVWPVLQTLKTYNVVTTSGVAGRGTIMAQTLVTVEYWYALVQLLAIFGYAFMKPSDNDHRHRQWIERTTQLDEILSASREISVILDWTRVMFHALFINQLDELYLASPQSDNNNNGDGTNERDHETMSVDSNKTNDNTQLMVPLAKRIV